MGKTFIEQQLNSLLYVALRLRRLILWHEILFAETIADIINELRLLFDQVQIDENSLLIFMIFGDVVHESFSAPSFLSKKDNDFLLITSLKAPNIVA